jgi:hypothetical protein
VIGACLYLPPNRPALFVNRDPSIFQKLIAPPPLIIWYSDDVIGFLGRTHIEKKTGFLSL